MPAADMTSVVFLGTYFLIRYSMVVASTSGGRRSSGCGTECPAPALTYSFTAITSPPFVISRT